MAWGYNYDTEVLLAQSSIIQARMQHSTFAAASMIDNTLSASYNVRRVKYTPVSCVYS
jgi:hypothetical protein